MSRVLILPADRKEDRERSSQTLAIPDRKTFERIAELHRQELKLHCYRMLGSLQDAEDAVQETYLRAWRGLNGYRGHASLRAWLYRIATNVSLSVLSRRKIRHNLLPDQRSDPTEQMPEGTPATDLAWLEPYPDRGLVEIADDAPNPEARFATKEAVQLAFVAAIQQLPPRQRAAVLLCDVLGWSAVDIASLIGGSSASVNSALQRARDTLSRRYSRGRPQAQPMLEQDEQLLIEKYMRAWEADDLDSFVDLLRQDAVYIMPPWMQWYSGRSSIRRFFGQVWKFYGGFRLIPTGANRQPAFAVYSRGREREEWTAHSIQVLTVQDGAISKLTAFMKPIGPQLFPAFGHPLSLPDE